MQMLTDFLENVYDERFYSDVSTRPYRQRRSEIGVSISGNLVIVKRSFSGLSNFGSGEQTREPIKSFSPSSGRRMQKYLRESVSEYKTFITLTYPHGHGFEGGSAKRNLASFLKRLRRYCERQDFVGFSALWFMEFQARGSIHFHLLCTHRVEWSWIAKSWYQICGTDDERHLRAGTSIEAIRAGRAGISVYLRKYAAKQYQKVVPDHFGWVGRFWGVAGVRSVKHACTKICEKTAQNDAYVRNFSTLMANIEKTAQESGVKVLANKPNDVVVMAIENREALARVSTWIQKVEFKRCAWFPSVYIYEYPELLGDISDE